MQIQAAIAEQRALLLRCFFPKGIPSLWCPPLTHYTQEGAVDRARIAAHLRHLSAHVKGFLIAGSTSDGWELSDEEFRKLIEIGLEHAQPLGLYLLIGVLKADARQAREKLLEVVKLIQSHTGESDPQKALIEARVCGFTVCSPRGKNVSQQEMESGLVQLLETRVPVALYQLPQVTENEMGSELLQSLAQRFANFVFFKDSSGTDRVVSSGTDLGQVFTMRGAEGNYLKWLKTSGHGYDGFLLSSANSFARQLDEIVSRAAAGCPDEVRKTSEQITSIINETFDLVRGLPDGNTFANANKALDHFSAYGQGAERIPGPRLHAGSRIPDEVIWKTGEVLRRHGCMPELGYLQG